MDFVLILIFILSFLSSFVATKFWISRAKKASLVAKDVHKIDPVGTADIGGLPVMFAFLVGVLSYVAVRVFYFGGDEEKLISIFAILVAVLIAAIIGLVDDILGWKIGLKQWQKPALTILVALPIMAVDAGTRIMQIPFFGPLDLGVWYPLFVIPAVLIVTSNATNMLAGYNGLEAGLAGIILSTLGFLAFKSGVDFIAGICFIMALVICAFLCFNWFPAKVFPGDTFTYATGALIGAVAIFADLEKALVILFVPFAIEFFLKLRGKFQKESFAKVCEDGSLDLRYEKIYGLEHMAILVLKKLKFKVTERKVVLSLYSFQIIFVILALIL